MLEPMIKISQLFLYPVKSCRGIAVESSRLLPQGLEHDRQWMIVDENGHFLTQRQAPAMARIVAALSTSASSVPDLILQLADESGCLNPGAGKLRVRAGFGESSRPVRVWSDELPSIDCGSDAAAFLSEFLGRPARLVRFDDRQSRTCSQKWTGNTTSHTRFADGFPVLVLGESSVIDLAGKMGLSHLPVERFRPNVLISGLPAYEEDFIRTLTTADDGMPQVKLELVKPCTRCSIPGLNHESGRQESTDPTAQLATFRYLSAVQGAALGMNAIVLETLAGAKPHEYPSLNTGQILNPIYHF